LETFGIPARSRTGSLGLERRAENPFHRNNPIAPNNGVRVNAKSRNLKLKAPTAKAKNPAIPALANITKNILEQPKLKLRVQTQNTPQGGLGETLDVALPKTSLKARQ
jgi:hypothetical protein